METRRLRYFLKIADAGSISKAAAELGLAQPALSQQLAVLETELKARLVERSSAGVALTPAGQALYDRAATILRALDELADEVRSERGAVTGRVIGAFTPTIAMALAPRLIGRLRDVHPRVRLLLREGGSTTIGEDLLKGRLDFAVLPVRVQSPRLHHELLLTEELLVISSAKAAPPPTDLGALAARPWIVTSAPNAVRALLDAAFASAGLQANIAAEADSLPVVIGAVAMGLGMTLLPRAAVEDAIASGVLRASPFGAERVERQVFLCQPAGHAPSDAASAVMGIIRQLAQSG